MASRISAKDTLEMNLEEMGKRLAAKSGIPSDRYHLGKLVLQTLKNDPDFLLQIDGATGQSETSASVLERTIRCAFAFQDLGLKHGDVMVLMAPYHLDVAIPFYAALYLGLIIAAVDITLGRKEIQDALKDTQPKIILCQNEKSSYIEKEIENLHLNCKVVTFDKSDHHIKFAKLLEKYKDAKIDNFKPTDFDPEESIVFLTTTSGSTGLPKAAALTYKNLLIGNNTFRTRKSDSPKNMLLILSPLQWISPKNCFLLSPILNYTRLQTSLPSSSKHVVELINTYKPSAMIVNPTFMTSLIKHSQQEHCDFSCFKEVLLSGSAARKDLKEETKILMPTANIYFGYGLSEVPDIIFDLKDSPIDSVGKPMKRYMYRIIDIESQEDIEEPNRPGELWLKGPAVFKGYYNNPEATKQVLTQDGWLKTGDIFYRDEQWFYYFVDRVKQLLKYKSSQIFPVVLENVIQGHPGVLDVIVTGIPDPECGDLAVACVVRRPRSYVTAQEIKDLIKDTLSDSKQLRGGVIFFDELPVTATGKVDRMKLKTLVKELERE